MNDEKKKVFIIDDDELLLDMYSVKLRESGFDVEVAISGDAALDKIKNGFNPDILLLDVVMPGMDGFEFLKKLRSEKLIPGKNIVILSNLGQKEEIEKATAFGIKNYIIKAHYTPSEVVAKVKELLNQPR